MGSALSFMMETSSETDKIPVDLQMRSEGDGMENVPDPEISAPFQVKAQKINPKVIHKSVLITPSAGKRKEPKYVPYEPYKAAVSAIAPETRTRNLSNSKKSDVNSLNSSHSFKLQLQESSHSNEFLPQDSQITNNEILQRNVVEPCLWLQEKVILENKISSLIEEKKDLETQFNIQTKVNADLKKLLVASLGEDIQTKVQYMSEDKAKLGEHVLFYSEKLNENSEELDKIAVQCDIWKSKFEASSLIVEELANWKSVLNKTLTESTNATQCLLSEHKEIHHKILETFSCLYRIQEAIDSSAPSKTSCSYSQWNLFQLSGAIRNLAEDIESQLLISNKSFPLMNKIELPVDKQSLTHGEQLAVKVLSNVDRLPETVKFESYNRETSKSHGTRACSILPHNCSTEATVNCCRHCSGEIRLV